IKPALIKYSEESGASTACAAIVDVQLNVIPSATIRIPSRRNIKFPALVCSEFNRQSNLKPDRNTAVDRALDLGRSGIDEIWNEFQMVVIQQILSANRKFYGGNRPPAKMGIQRIIAGYIQARKMIHETQSSIVLEVLWQID